MQDILDELGFDDRLKERVLAKTEIKHKTPTSTATSVIDLLKKEINSQYLGVVPVVKGPE